MKVQIQNLSLTLGANTVLRDISCLIEPGQSALLLGPSGSGKTSLLHTICGLQKPNEGEVRIGDDLIASASNNANSDAVRRRYMGIVFQTLRLVSALSIRANLLLAQRLQTGRADPAFADAMIARLGIEHRADARPFELSQGEAQRAAIARALVVRPKVLVADEPTSALDNANANRVAQLLVETADEAQATLLVATHDERLNAHFDREIKLADGGLIS